MEHHVLEKREMSASSESRDIDQHALARPVHRAHDRISAEENTDSAICNRSFGVAFSHNQFSKLLAFETGSRDQVRC
jgi:hypothetical protein